MSWACAGATDSCAGVDPLRWDRILFVILPWSQLGKSIECHMCSIASFHGCECKILCLCGLEYFCSVSRLVSGVSISEPSLRSWIESPYLTGDARVILHNLNGRNRGRREQENLSRHRSQMRPLKHFSNFSILLQIYQHQCGCKEHDKMMFCSFQHGYKEVRERSHGGDGGGVHKGKTKATVGRGNEFAVGKGIRHWGTQGHKKLWAGEPCLISLRMVLWIYKGPSGVMLVGRWSECLEVNSQKTNKTEMTCVRKSYILIQCI